MVSRRTPHTPRFHWKIALHFVLVFVLLSTQLLLPLRRTQAKPQEIIGTVLTVGGLLVAGKLALDKLDGIMDEVDAITRERLTQAREEIERLVDLIEEKYQDNLNLTLDSLDTFAAGQFNRAFNLIIDINQELERTVGTIEESAVRVIEQAGAQLNASVDFIIERVQQTVVVTAESGVWVIDNLWETIITIIALLFLVGVLLIGYSQIGPIIRMERLPSPPRLAAFAALGVFLFAIGLMLLLWQPARNYIMTRSVSALEDRLAVNISPQIFSVIPNTLRVGEETELTIIGSNLPTGETPTVVIGEVEVPVEIAQDDIIVVTLTAEAANQSGAQEVIVQYTSLGEALADVVEFTDPGPDLVVTNISINPQSPIAGTNYEATVRVRNQGSAVQRFIVEWNPGLPGTAITRDDAQPLQQGETREYTFSSSYEQPNTYQAFARILDTMPDETNLNAQNNRLNINITVRPEPVEQPTPPPQIPTVPPFLDQPPVCLQKPYLPQCDFGF